MVRAVLIFRSTAELYESRFLRPDAYVAGKQKIEHREKLVQLWALSSSLSVTGEGQIWKKWLQRAGKYTTTGQGK